MALLYREQTVFVPGEKSLPATVMSGVPQRTVLVPLIFLVYINDIVAYNFQVTADPALVLETELSSTA